MQTASRQEHRPYSWGSAFAASLFCITLLIAATAATAQPSPATPTSTAGKAYVGIFKDDAVAVLDTSTNRVLRTIPVPKGPHGLVMTPDGRKVYVSSDGASTVSVIDMNTDQVLSSIDVGPNPHGLAISPDGRKLLVMAFGTNQAIIVDTTSDRILGQIPVPMAHNGAISSDGRLAYVGSQQQGNTAIVVLDLSKMQEIAKVPLNRTPRGLDLSPDGKWLYFTVARMDAVLVLDTATNQVVSQIVTGASPHVALFAPDGQIALVVTQGPGELTLIEPTNHTLSAALKVGTAPHWLAISADSRTAYITNEGSNEVSVVDLSNRQVTANIPVGNAPRKIAVQPRVRTGALAPTRSSVEGTSTQHMSPASDHETREVTGLVEVRIEADDYYFAPTFLHGQPGQRLTLSVENKSGTLHNLSISELQIDHDIPPQGRMNVEITFPSSGSVRFFCKLHAAMGMKGELRAEYGILQAKAGRERLGIYLPFTYPSFKRHVLAVLSGTGIMSPDIP
jgi:YVTN family beta-propeller protein